MSHIHGTRLGHRGAALWWVGWHPVVTPVVGAGGGLAASNALAIPLGLLFGVGALTTMVAGTALGAAAGVVAWYVGTRAVNRDYGAVVSSVGSGTRTPGDDESTTFVLLADGIGSRPLVEPDRRYEATVLTLAPDAIDVRHGTFDLVDRRPYLDDDAGMAIPYERVRAVSADDAEVSIETTTDDRFTYPTASDPTDLVRAIRERIDG